MNILLNKQITFKVGSQSNVESPPDPKPLQIAPIFIDSDGQIHLDLDAEPGPLPDPPKPRDWISKPVMFRRSDPEEMKLLQQAKAMPNFTESVKQFLRSLQPANTNKPGHVDAGPPPLD